MKLSRSICSVATAGLLILAVASPSVSFAHDQACHPGERQQITPEQGGAWIKDQLDREATWLEIKASQQAVWEAYVAANIELLNGYATFKPVAPNTDAAGIVRQHADHAAVFAQNIAKVADATEKLQAVLTEDQRKVLDRIVRVHSQFPGRGFGPEEGGHWHHHHDADVKAGAPKAAPKSASPAKPKN